MDNDFSFDEKTLLSILLCSEGLDEVVVEKVFNHIPDKMLVDRQSKGVYSVIKELYASDDRELLGSHHFLHKVMQMASMEVYEGDVYLSDIEHYWMPPATVNTWVKKIQKRYFDNRFKDASNEEEFEDVISEKQRYSVEVRMADISDDACKAISLYEEKKDSAIFTNIGSIDNCIGSLQGGDMIVLAGATGGGKTCFMLNIAKNIAKAGKKVDIFSLEMPRYQLQQRIICSEACVDASRFRSFSLTDEDKQRYYDYANGEFKKLPMRIFTKQTVTIEEIKQIEMKSDADIVFIDYLGLIDSYGNKSSYEKYSEISRNIKLIAMATNKPIVALHQLNRSFQDREDKKPKVSDLRDSGKIEQDADMIWLVYRPWMFDPEYAKEDIRFILAKDRHGASNQEIPLIFNGMYQQILERPL